ncbi:hypothetical protein NQ318_005948 [Aromia moschata]|uniref:WKF domain-containing protein n=1 Tax=Aromia moschata TaxID=1265417 RepID=A0AAV8YEY5_9CUCU|nr:hypothetical protein NQ318_005948 [Aromia moschata]
MDKPHKNKKKKSKKVISFDEEIITKDGAGKILLHESITPQEKVNETNETSISHGNNDEVIDSEQKNKVKEKKSSNRELETKETDNADEISVEKPEIKRDESIRAQKRKKHAKLLDDKRLKAELNSQQNALNYLSLWKHNREEWKFEKLKQIWLQQSLFEPSKIPSEFWNTVVEYFCGARGAIRTVILKSALEIIEKVDKSEEDNTDENYLLILQRARDIVQNLQE